jgi:hypothetical protein
MTQATTSTPRAAEMPETVLMPTPREFLQKFAKNQSELQNFVKKKSQNRPVLSERFQLVKYLLDYRKSSFASLIFEVR